MIVRAALALLAILALPLAPAAAQKFELPLRADDGKIVANHSVPAGTQQRLDKLPGIVVVGNPQGDVTIYEFYDLNCPYCRRAAADLRDLLHADRNVKLVLVPLPVLGVPSILAGRVELAAARQLPPDRFYRFHLALYEGRGVVDGERALAAAQKAGLKAEEVVAAANDGAITDTMRAHLQLANELQLMATPSYVIGGSAILGHPGGKALRSAVAAVRRCKKIVC